jgi:hypothetical protein
MQVSHEHPKVPGEASSKTWILQWRKQRHHGPMN